MKFRPLYDRILVERVGDEEKTKSGIIIPDAAKEKSQEGEVLAVGPGKVNENTGARNPIDLKVGDKILYSKYAGTEFKTEGEEVLMIDEGDVLAVIEK